MSMSCRGPGVWVEGRSRGEDAKRTSEEKLFWKSVELFICASLKLK